jgi:hypothetical protein
MFVLLLVLGASDAIAAKDPGDVVKTPLNTIWAYAMPGTRDIHELEKTALSAKQAASLDNQIGNVLQFLPKSKTTAKGFAVAGTEKEALSKALSAFIKKQQPRQAFPANAQVIVFFFSHSFGQYVHLNDVERREKTIKIVYRFVPHKTKQLTAHYALIPLGKLPIGKYRVDIVRLPLEQKYVNQGFKSVDSQWGNRVVCQPFSFEVIQ